MLKTTTTASPKWSCSTSRMFVSGHRLKYSKIWCKNINRRPYKSKTTIATNSKSLRNNGTRNWPAWGRRSWFKLMRCDRRISCRYRSCRFTCNLPCPPDLSRALICWIYEKSNKSWANRKITLRPKEFNLRYISWRKGSTRHLWK